MRDEALTYKINEGQLLTYLLFIIFLTGQINFIYVAGLNINFLVTFLLSLVLLIKLNILVNRWFIFTAAVLLFFLLLHIDYYSVYFVTFYLTVVFSYFTGKYSPPVNLFDLFKKLLIINLALNVLYYAFVTHSPFILEGGKLRLISISGGPPATSFVFMTYFLFFASERKWLWTIIPFVLIVLTGNRITIMVAVLLTGMYLLTTLNFKRVLILGGIFLALAIVVFSTNLDKALLQKARFLDHSGKLNLATFEGRVVHWKWAIVHWKDASLWHKLFGHGINSTKEIFFTTYTYRGERTGSGAMHNEYLRVLVENGIAGLVAVFVLFATLIRNAFRNKDRFRSMCLIGAILLTAITDNILYSYYNYLVIIFFLLGYHFKYRNSTDATV